MNRANQKAKGKNGKSKIAVRLGRSFILPFHFCLLPFVFHSALAAEVLPDPTRPPPLEASVEAPGMAVVTTGPVLQSVMIRPGRRAAVISGQLLAEGERFGDSKLIRISEGEVILAGPGGRQTLKLFPGVEKQFVRPPQKKMRKRGNNQSKRNSEQKAS